MQPFGVIASRVLVPLLGLVIWFLIHLDARLAYRLPRGAKRFALQISTVLGAAGTFALQLELMERFSPTDAQGGYFFGFILIECGGALVVLFSTLLRERSRSMKRTSGTLNSTGETP
jgi:hypothetical protein